MAGQAAPDDRGAASARRWDEEDDPPTSQWPPRKDRRAEEGTGTGRFQGGGGGGGGGTSGSRQGSRQICTPELSVPIEKHPGHISWTCCPSRPRPEARGHYSLSWAKYCLPSSWLWLRSLATILHGLLSTPPRIALALPQALDPALPLSPVANPNLALFFFFALYPAVARYQATTIDVIRDNQQSLLSCIPMTKTAPTTRPPLSGATSIGLYK